MYWLDVNDKKHGKRKMYYTEISWNRNGILKLNIKNIQVDSYKILKNPNNINNEND